MTTKFKPELLNDSLDVNGIGLTLPADAIGVVGETVGEGFSVVRNGQEIAVKAGQILLKGDIIRTAGAVQTIYLSSSQAVAMTKIALAANQNLALDGNTELALQGEVVEVAATEVLTPELLAAGDETTGLFGALGAATIAGVPVAGVAAGAVALAALGSSGGDSAAAEETPPMGDTPPPANEPTPETGGQLSSGAAQLDGALAGTPIGGALPFSFADGAAQLEGALPVGGAPGGGAGGDAGGNPLTSGAAQLDGALAGTPLGGALPFTFAGGAEMLAGALPAAPASSNSALPVDLGSITSVIGSTAGADALSGLTSALPLGV